MREYPSDCLERHCNRGLPLSLCVFFFFTALCVNSLQAPAVEIVRPNAPNHLARLSFASTLSSPWMGASSTAPHWATQDAPTVISTQLPRELFTTWKKDKVVRVVDANTIKLDKQGLVTLAGMQMPSASASFQFPDCFDKSPSYKIRKLLPAGTVVRVQTISAMSSTGASSAALVVLNADGTLVNAALVEAGFGRIKEKSAKQAEAIVPKFSATIASLQRRAQTSHAGMYQFCHASNGELVETAIFEPLEAEPPVIIPPNPGDRRNCADFETYEDALRYYETFLPYYGDVARLDRDKDGVPCPGLAHTANPDLYRMKVPKDRQGMAKPEQE